MRPPKARGGRSQVRALPSPDHGLDVSYIETTTPHRADGDGGHPPARTNVTELAVVPYALYQFTAAQRTAGYSFTRDTIADGPTDFTHRVEPSFSHQFTPLDTGALHYRASVFETEGARTVTSHAPMAAWTRQLTPVTSFTIRGGPRFIYDGSIEPRSSLDRALNQVGQARAGVCAHRRDLAGTPPVEVSP
jgi:hypothetical protein